MGDSSSMKHKGQQQTFWPNGKNRWRRAACMSIKKEEKHYPADQCKGAHQWIIQSSACQPIRLTRLWSDVHCTQEYKASMHSLTTLDTKVQGHSSSSFQFSYPSSLQFSYPCWVTVLPPDEISKPTSNKTVLLKILNLFFILKTPVFIFCLKFHNYIFI